MAHSGSLSNAGTAFAASAAPEISRGARLLAFPRWSRTRALLVMLGAAIALVGFRGVYVLTPYGGSDAQNYLGYASYLARFHTLPPAALNPSEYSTPPLYEASAGLLEWLGHRLPSFSLELHSRLLTALAWLALVAAACAAMTAARLVVRRLGAAGLVLALLWALDEVITLAKLQDWSEGQLVSLTFMLGLLVVTALISRELWPGHPRRALAAAAMALAYPIVFRLGIMFHPEMTLAFICSLVLLTVLRAQRSQWPWRLGAVTGILLGLGASVRQSISVVILSVALAVALAGGRRALPFLAAAAIGVVLVAGPWWGYATNRWGSPIKLALDRPGHMSSSGEPLSFWVSFPLGSLITHPYRPDFTNQLLPTLHADLWADYWGSLRNEWSGQSKLTTFVASTQSTLGFGWDALALVGLFGFGLPAAIRLLLRRTRDAPDFAAGFLTLVTVAAFIAFVLTILRYPQFDGKEIKSSYMLFVTPCWALLTLHGWLRTSARSAFAARMLLPSFAALYALSYVTDLYTFLR